jgi:hypothetical protein
MRWSHTELACEAAIMVAWQHAPAGRWISPDNPVPELFSKEHVVPWAGFARGSHHTLQLEAPADLGELLRVVVKQRKPGDSDVGVGWWVASVCSGCGL